MGYSGQIREQSFRVASADKPAALAALKVFAGGGRKIRWVENKEVMAAESFADAMEALLWRVRLDDDCNVVGIRFDAGDNKLGDEDEWMQVIAPFVQPGSYIEMQGEDGDIWRWVFNGQAMVTMRQRVIEWGEVE